MTENKQESVLEDEKVEPDKVPDKPAITEDGTVADKKSLRSTILKVALPIVLALILAFLVPHPASLDIRAWYYFCIFVAVIISVALEVLPMGAVGLIGVCIMAATGVYFQAGWDAEKSGAWTNTNVLTWALSGFSNSVVWMVFAAMLFAVALKKTGIGRRIALGFIRLLGKTSLGLGYAITLADFVLGPFMPSNTARSFGTIYPIARATSEALDSHPDDESAGKVGSFLLFTAFTATFISSATFLTAAAMTILGTKIISDATGTPPLSWMSYLIGFIPQAIIIIIITPLIARKFFPPTITKFPEAPKWAKEQLTEMGRLTAKEIITLAIFVCALAGWIFLKDYMPTAMTAIIAVAAMLIFKVITWHDVLHESPAWNILVVLGTLITLANGLRDVGFLKWVSTASGNMFSHVGKSLMLVIIAMLALALIDFLLHYLYVSITAHVSTLMPLWMAVVVAIPGFPAHLFGMLLLRTKEGYGALTPYGAGHGVGYMLSGYFPDHKQFWKAESVWAYTYLGIAFISIPYWALVYGWH